MCLLCMCVSPFLILGLRVPHHIPTALRRSQTRSSSSLHASTRPQQTIAIAGTVLSILGSTLSTTIISAPSVAWAATDDSSSVKSVSGKLIRTAPASEELTASSLIQSDIDFYFKELQDMGYVLKQCDQIIENRDYESIRGILRQEPLRTLRKTSKALQKVCALI